MKVMGHICPLHRSDVHACANIHFLDRRQHLQHVLRAGSYAGLLPLWLRSPDVQYVRGIVCGLFQHLEGHFGPELRDLGGVGGAQYLFFGFSFDLHSPSPERREAVGFFEVRLTGIKRPKAPWKSGKRAETLILCSCKCHMHLFNRLGSEGCRADFGDCVSKPTPVLHFVKTAFQALLPQTKTNCSSCDNFVHRLEL